MSGKPWRVDLAPNATRDLIEILRWTRSAFGAREAAIYRQTILAAVTALRRGPEPTGSRRRDDLMTGVRTMHVARLGKRGRHMLVYRVRASDRIEVLRILHDAMDPSRHVGDMSLDGE